LLKYFELNDKAEVWGQNSGGNRDDGGVRRSLYRPVNFTIIFSKLVFKLMQF